jgi:hypothetical protein
MCADILIEYGVDENILNNDGKRPWDMKDKF